MDIEGIIESIESLRAERETWCPKFKIESNEDAIALLNVFGAFR